ncbi:Bloom syndrome protein homolog [Exaiptasia diaphana]|uniref:DNA 3'-5' helicase n=1 Tax=Exaiptasia diaphana TaxID=2652724 RepID=A0A913XDW9_EXADI|nr:Bloom syndrome protein homolog [Exaiptasia diaphana]
MAVTATATDKTRSDIIGVLRLKDFVDIHQSPNKDNLAFHVIHMDTTHSVLDYFQWVLRDVKENKKDRTIIYCQTIKQCANLYSLFLKELDLNKENHEGRKVEMLHALSTKSVKENILKAMANEDGCIKVLICTIAFGMGVNCKGVNNIIHFGPSKTVEAYIQESGRAGRDGRPSNCIILYKALMLLHVEKEMRDYVRGKCDCRRQYLMSSFEITTNSCQGQSKCDKCSGSTEFSPSIEQKITDDTPKRQIQPAQLSQLKKKLIIFRKNMYCELIKQSPTGQLPVITIPDLLLGFSNNQIDQIIEHCDKIFDLPDLYKYVEIWKRRHAITILKIIREVFDEERQDDGDEDELSDDDLEFDDDVDDKDMWEIVIPNEELMELDWDELSYSGLFPEDMSILEYSAEQIPDIPDAVAGMIDNIQMD